MLTPTRYGGWRIGVDLGGTKIAATALAADGSELPRRRVATPNTYSEIVGAVHALVSSVDADLEALAGDVALGCPVGVGHPGSTNRSSGRIRNSNSLVLNGQRLADDLTRTFARPTRLANDANCFALAEARDGSAAGHQVVFGVIIGTGTGGGLVVNGRVLSGRNGLGGEWGHIPLPWTGESERPGPLCYCGLSGCIETWLSGSGLVRTYHGLGGSAAITAAEIATQASSGDVVSNRALELYIDRLARSLAVIINVVDPDIIVLGGGLSNIPRLVADVPERMQRWAFADAINTPVVSAHHGDAGGVRGAAQLFEVGETTSR